MKEDLTGQKFGRLKVVRFARWKIFPAGNRRVVWSCLCDCGAEKSVLAMHLKAGKIRSCGCLAHDLTVKRNTIHGYCRRSNVHPLFHVWNAMIGRCSNPRIKEWGNYGGRGILVCRRWRKIENFINDMYPSFKPGLEIDRIDNSKGYYPGNCRWVTHQQQMLNTRRNRVVKIGIVSKTVTEWCREMRFNIGTFYWRTRRGMTDADALTTPLKPGVKYVI